jgi:hypothetical protein
MVESGSARSSPLSRLLAYDGDPELPADETLMPEG